MLGQIEAKRANVYNGGCEQVAARVSTEIHIPAIVDAIYNQAVETLKKVEQIAQTIGCQTYPENPTEKSNQTGVFSQLEAVGYVVLKTQQRVNDIASCLGQ